MTLTLQVKWKQWWFSYFSFRLLKHVLKATGNQDQAPAWNKEIQEYSIFWLDTWESWFLTLRARSNIHFLFFYILFISFSMPLPKGNASTVRETTVVTLRTCFSHFRISAQKKNPFCPHGTWSRDKHCPENYSAVKRSQWPNFCPEDHKEDPENCRY